MMERFKNVKLLAFLKKYAYQIALACLVVIFFLINFFDLKYKIELDSSLNKYYIVFLAVALIASGIIIALCKYLKDLSDTKIPKVFAISAAILGLIYLFLSPLFTGSDEQNHYYRIYEITEGVMVTPTGDAVGAEMPVSLSDAFMEGHEKYDPEHPKEMNVLKKYSDINEMAAIQLDTNNTMQYGATYSGLYVNTALYSPVQYLPHAIGFVLARTFGAGPYVIGMMGRVFNLLFYVLLGYFCLKTVPRAKMFFMLILLSPNMLQCATTLSADAFTNVIFLLLIALIFKICYSKDKIDIKNEILLFVLCVVISLCKIVYLPVVFLILLIKPNSFKHGKKEKIIFSVVTIGISMLVGLAWMKMTDPVFDIAYTQTEAQKQFILANLFEYCVVLLRSFAMQMVKFVECLFVGTTMYHTQLDMPPLISFFYVALVGIALLNDKKARPEEMSPLERSAVGAVGIVIMGLISTAIYIQCTAMSGPIGNPTVIGIQGRYFIPIVMLLPFIFQFKGAKLKLIRNNLYTGALVVSLITWLYMVPQFVA